MSAFEEFAQSLLFQSLQVNHQFHRAAVFSKAEVHLIHQLPHQKHPATARLQQILVVERIRQMVGIKAFAFILDTHHDAVVLPKENHQTNIFPRIRLVAMQNGVVDGFRAGHEETIECPIVELRRFVDLVQEFLDMGDLLRLADALHFESFNAIDFCACSFSQ